MPTARAAKHRRERPGAPRGEAQPGPHRLPRGTERGSESPSRVSRTNRRGRPPVPPRRPRGRRRVYDTSRHDRRDEDREDEERAEHDAIDPAGVGDERQAREEEHREREDVEAAVEHDRREAPPAGERAARHPARPEQVADPSGQHVVHRHAGDDHLDELPLRRGACPRSSSSGRPAASRRRRCRPPPPRAGASRTSCSVRQTALEVGPADREEEEDRGRRDADDRRDRKRAAASAVPARPEHDAARRPIVRERRSRSKDAEHPPSRPAATVPEHPSRSSRPLPAVRADHSRTPGECATRGRSAATDPGAPPSRRPTADVDHRSQAPFPT